jgi:hypothetical protein
MKIIFNDTGEAMLLFKAFSRIYNHMPLLLSDVLSLLSGHTLDYTGEPHAEDSDERWQDNSQYFKAVSFTTLGELLAVDLDIDFSDSVKKFMEGVETLKSGKDPVGDV